MIGQAITKTVQDWLNQKENELIGGVLFSESTNGQILLFNNFGICTQNNLSLKSDITNHYTEENYWINDHWAINPPQYTLSGLIGELIYTVPEGWAQKIESLYGPTGLGLLSVLSPTLGSYTSGVLNITRKVQSVVDKYINIAKQSASKIKDFALKKAGITVVKKTNQRRVLNELENLMNNRVLVNVVTPYGTYNRLAIVAINIRQNDNTRFISDVEITFQKWRSIDELYADVNSEKMLADVAAAQKAPEKQKGLIGTVKSNINLFKQNDLG
ncbi:phage baseplate protein [Faecalibacillus faecis]|uniref:phage baseplate protein n=1 Tax=Faecalibacillus faecis TaxID=1982628 RepID=UPI003864FA55